MSDTRIDDTIVGPGGVATADVFGIEVNVLLTAEATGGAFSTYRVTVPPGLGSPPHVHHNDDEAFLVLDGEFEFLRGDEVIRAGAGTSVFLPRNVPHLFRNAGSATGVLIGTATPGGHEKFFLDAGRLSFPPDPAEAMAVCARHGMDLLPGLGPK